MLNGKSRDVGLGAAAGQDAISLADARDAAAALRLKMKAGIEPPEERRRIAAEAPAEAQAAKARGYREGEIPARWRGHFAQILPVPAQAK